MAQSMPVAIASDQTPVPVAADSSQVNVGGTLVTPKFAVITASASGATTIVAAVGSGGTAKRIRVIQWTLLTSAAVNVKWQSKPAGAASDITGLHYFVGNQGVASPQADKGLFQTVAGEALDINLSGAVAAGGSLVYVEV